MERFGGLESLYVRGRLSRRLSVAAHGKFDTPCVCFSDLQQSSTLSTLPAGVFANQVALNFLLVLIAIYFSREAINNTVVVCSVEICNGIPLQN